LKANKNHMSDELLVKYLLGEAGTVERHEVEQWINASPVNKKYFDHFQLIWETSKQLVIPATVDADEAWQRFRQRTEKKPAIVRRINARSTWLRAAAIAVVCLSILSLAYFLTDRLSTTAVTVVTTDTPKADTLPDGSLIVLNKNSSIRYHSKLKGAKRKVDLKGEAFFTVTPDKQKPFEISVNDITVTVVGTSFNIKDIEGKTQVIVETGIVRVSKNNISVELRPGESIITESAKSVFEKEKTTDKLYQYYRSKEFVCDNTPLWKLVEVLNEAYNVNIIIERAELRSLPLTTTFYNESLEKILTVIAETFEITVERKGGQIILK
jgi:transmembrane sensor